MCVLLAACEGSHRRTVAAFLEGRGHVVVITGDGAEAVAIAKDGVVEMVVTGPTMPGICGYELTRNLRELVPELPVILMSAGGDTLDPVLLECTETLGRLNAGPGEPGCLAKLTQRERQVFDLIVSGNGNKAVARLLSISPRTVENHRAQVMRKTNARNLAELVHLALSPGVPPGR